MLQRNTQQASRGLVKTKQSKIKYFPPPQNIWIVVGYSPEKILRRTEDFYLSGPPMIMD